jgi:hypothetical protein
MADNNAYNEALIIEAKRIEEDAIYSAKGHFEAARAWDHWHLWIGIPTAIVSAIAGVAALSQHSVVAAVLSLVVAASTALVTFLNAKERATHHLRAGNAYKSLQNDARIFRDIECGAGAVPLGDQQCGIRDLNARRNKLNEESPQIPRRAFERARKTIRAGEAKYKVDKT